MIRIVYIIYILLISGTQSSFSNEISTVVLSSYYEVGPGTLDHELILANHGAYLQHDLVKQKIRIIKAFKPSELVEYYCVYEKINFYNASWDSQVSDSNKLTDYFPEYTLLTVSPINVDPIQFIINAEENFENTSFAKSDALGRRMLYGVKVMGYLQGGKVAITRAIKVLNKHADASNKNLSELGGFIPNFVIPTAIEITRLSKRFDNGVNNIIESAYNSRDRLDEDNLYFVYINSREGIEPFSEVISPYIFEAMDIYFEKGYAQDYRHACPEFEL